MKLFNYRRKQHYELFFYGVRPLTTKSGINTNAIFGFLNIMMKTIKEIEPDGVAVAFDLPVPTFRHKMYDGYKGILASPPQRAEGAVSLY